MVMANLAGRATNTARGIVPVTAPAIVKGKGPATVKGMERGRGIDSCNT
jgi:hypothetical protein